MHVHHLHPLLAAELDDDWELERVLAHGTLPGVYAEPDAALRCADLRAYTDAYLREEVQAEALVRNLGGYTRLLDLVAASSGHVLNIGALCRDAGMAWETTRRYIEVLEDTLLVRRVPAWSGSDRQRLVAHPKLFLFDVGVRNALLRRPLDRCLDDDRGVLLEHVVSQELHARVGVPWPELAVSHYRTRHGAEVDFVLEIGTGAAQEVWGVEVKASRQVRRSALSGLASLAGRLGDRLTRRIVVYLGERAQAIDGVEILPLSTFLGELPA